MPMKRAVSPSSVAARLDKVDMREGAVIMDMRPLATYKLP